MANNLGNVGLAHLCFIIEQLICSTFLCQSQWSCERRHICRRCEAVKCGTRSVAIDYRRLAVQVLLVPREVRWRNSTGTGSPDMTQEDQQASDIAPDDKLASDMTSDGKVCDWVQGWSSAHSLCLHTREFVNHILIHKSCPINWLIANSESAGIERFGIGMSARCCLAYVCEIYLKKVYISTLILKGRGSKKPIPWSVALWEIPQSVAGWYIKYKCKTSFLFHNE